MSLSIGKGSLVLLLNSRCVGYHVFEIADVILGNRFFEFAHARLTPLGKTTRFVVVLCGIGIHYSEI